MIISDVHRYVYVGIPRTGSKSMNHWLMEHFDGRWRGGHHDYAVPDAAAGYLVFSIVRNPYERYVSGHFGVSWGELAPTDGQLDPFNGEGERLRRVRDYLAAVSKVRKEAPQRATPESLADRIREAAQLNEGSGHEINQARFFERAGATLALYFERLPACLSALPFVDLRRVPAFPHHPERGLRPAGNFFELFDGESEQVVWAHAAEDFELLGYSRFQSGLGAERPDACVDA